MEIPINVKNAMDDIIENYKFKKSEQKTIYMFIQTLSEYREK